ncbi:unnamed protein product [Leptosia nina]|uniref:DNA-3-methyladenine glycosylase I n=1 Tax=Leptosia nina TaxID=320188 RepID=A0AAV1JFL3_9NEOP
MEGIKITRCSWVNKDPLYISYHDNEWGIPEYESRKLFEIMCLEGQQAGLSWITILKKRNSYRNLFHNFDPYEIVKLDEENIQNLLIDARIIRHKGKIQSILNNAQCFINMEQNGEDFSDFIWSFVGKKQIVNNWTSPNQVPSETDISIKMSKSLKERGFKYVGSTICYAFMQASGLVDDHIKDCLCRNKK